MHRMRRSMLVKSRSSLMVFFTTVLLVSLGSASAGGKDPLCPSPVRPGNVDHRIELPQGYLKVYSVSDEFNAGAYYAHSSYTIYSTYSSDEQAGPTFAEACSWNLGCLHLCLCATVETFANA